MGTRLNRQQRREAEQRAVVQQVRRQQRLAPTPATIAEPREVLSSQQRDQLLEAALDARESGDDVTFQAICTRLARATTSESEGDVRQQLFPTSKRQAPTTRQTGGAKFAIKLRGNSAELFGRIKSDSGGSLVIQTIDEDSMMPTGREVAVPRALCKIFADHSTCFSAVRAMEGGTDRKTRVV